MWNSVATKTRLWQEQEQNGILIAGLHGYHIYKSIWTAMMGEHLDCVNKLLNARDRFAVVVMKEWRMEPWYAICLDGCPEFALFYLKRRKDWVNYYRSTIFIRLVTRRAGGAVCFGCPKEIFETAVLFIKKQKRC